MAVRKESHYRQSMLCASQIVSRIVTAYCEWDRAYSVQATGCTGCTVSSKMRSKYSTYPLQRQCILLCIACKLQLVF